MQNALISVIRSSLTAAQAALDVLEGHNLEPSPVIAGEARACDKYAPVLVEQEITDEPVTVTLLDRLMAALRDPRYTLRSPQSLADLLGVEYHEIRDMLDDNGVAYVERTRRRDGELMIGLAERN